MQIGPGCYEVCPAREISVNGPLFPWQNEYEVAKQEEVNSPATAQPVRSGPNVGRRLFTMDPMRELSWWEVDIRPKATVVFGNIGPGPVTPVTVDDVASANPILKGWTPVKVKVTYQETSGEVRSFIADVGTGVTISVPPTNKIDVDILVPREDGIQEIIDSGSAPPVQAEILRQLFFATTVSCKATCVTSPGLSRPRLTNLYFLDGSSVAGTAGFQTKLQAYASRVQIYAAPFAGGPALAAGDIIARFLREFVQTTQGVAPIDPLAGLFPFFDIPILTTVPLALSEHMDIPRSLANVVRVRTANAAVRASVLVSQELFL